MASPAVSRAAVSVDGVPTSATAARGRRRRQVARRDRTAAAAARAVDLDPAVLVRPAQDLDHFLGVGVDLPRLVRLPGVGRPSRGPGPSRARARRIGGARVGCGSGDTVRRRWLRERRPAAEAEAARTRHRSRRRSPTGARRVIAAIHRAASSSDSAAKVRTAAPHAVHEAEVDRGVTGLRCSSHTPHLVFGQSIDQRRFGADVDRRHFPGLVRVVDAKSPSIHLAPAPFPGAAIKSAPFLSHSQPSWGILLGCPLVLLLGVPGR